ncbi:hypothetical protein Patl1_28976 [Pistacia atlantica]|uniref:Uncharacterized protein n=1 Tax=Pistacia atlantica TaxID=434234 RepID=A0ACC1BDQ8_9ROSI|nr:hypothetical protein Patl1_28976 [Pistacia atlantica]
MDVEKLFHMTGGAGPSSYAKNSSLQGQLILLGTSLTIPSHLGFSDEIEEEVRREGSFKLDQLQMFHIKKEDYGDRHGYAVAATVRAIQESMIRHHFGVGEGSLDSLFEIYGRMVDEEMGKEEIKPWTFVLVLRKL